MTSLGVRKPGAFGPACFTFEVLTCVLPLGVTSLGQELSLVSPVAKKSVKVTQMYFVVRRVFECFMVPRDIENISSVCDLKKASRTHGVSMGKTYNITKTLRTSPSLIDR